MNAIQEALRELNRFNEAKKTRKVRVFDDLWDQVYCSLTDGGADSAYKALGDLNGKALYDVYDITSSDVRPGFDTLIVNSSKVEPALNVAKIYGLETKVIPGRAVYIYIPEGAPVRDDLLAKNRKVTAQEPIEENAIIEEDVESSIPVEFLSERTVRDFVESIPTITGTQPPQPFKLGYFNELTREIAAKFRGGRGSKDLPHVRIFKAKEYSRLYTKAPYQELGSTKKFRKETGIAAGHEKTGFHTTGTDSGDILNAIGRYPNGEAALQAYIRQDNKVKVAYYLSIDGSDLTLVPKEEIVQYLTPASAIKIADNNDPEDAPSTSPDNIRRFKLSKIYMLQNLGHSIVH